MKERTVTYRRICSCRIRLNAPWHRRNSAMLIQYRLSMPSSRSTRVCSSISTTREQLQNVIDNYNLAKQMGSYAVHAVFDLPVALPAVGGCFAIGQHLRKHHRLNERYYERQRRTPSPPNRSAFPRVSQLPGYSQLEPRGQRTIAFKEPALILAIQQTRPRSRPSALSAPTLSSGSKTSPTWRR